MKTRYILVSALLMLVVLTKPVIGGTDADERIRELEARIVLLEAMVEVRDRRIVELQEQLEASEVGTEPTALEEVQEVSNDDSLEDGVEALSDSEEADTEVVLTVEDFYELVKRYRAKGLTTAKRNAIVAEPVGSEFSVTAEVSDVAPDDAVIGGFVVTLVYKSRSTFVVTTRGPGYRYGGTLYPGKVSRKSLPKQVVCIEVATRDRSVLDFDEKSEVEVQGTITHFYVVSSKYACERSERLKAAVKTILTDEDLFEVAERRGVVYIRSSDCSFTCIEDE